MALHVVRRINRQVAPSAKLFYITSPGVVPVFLLKVLDDHDPAKLSTDDGWTEHELKLCADVSFVLARLAVHIWCRAENQLFSSIDIAPIAQLDARRQRQSRCPIGLSRHWRPGPLVLSRMPAQNNGCATRAIGSGRSPCDQKMSSCLGRPPVFLLKKCRKKITAKLAPDDHRVKHRRIMYPRY